MEEEYEKCVFCGVIVLEPFNEFKGKRVCRNCINQFIEKLK